MTPRSHLAPPSANRLSRETRCVVVDSDAHPPLILGDVIHAVGNGFAQLLVHEVMDEHLFRLSLRSPFSPAVLEFPEDFLLLGIDRDDRLSTILEGHDASVDVLKLGVAVGVVLAFLRFPIALQAVASRSQQAPHGAWADRMSLMGQFVSQLRCALTCPTQRRHRIPSRRRIDQAFQRRRQSRIGVDYTLTTSPRFSQPPGNWRFHRGASRIQFSEPSANGVRRHARCTAHGKPATPTVRSCFCRGPLTTHPFVHQRSQGSIPRFNPLNGGCILHGRLVPKHHKLVKLF